MDIHLDNVVVSVVRNELKNNRIGGKVVTTRKFNTIGPKNIEELMKWLEEYCAEQPHQAVVESTYNWYWLSDEFEKRGWNLRPRRHSMLPLSALIRRLSLPGVLSSSSPRKLLIPSLPPQGIAAFGAGPSETSADRCIRHPSNE